MNGQEEKILVVDDDINILKLTEILLKGKGYSVLTATNGREALGQIKKEPPNLIIADLTMQGMSGQEFVKQIRRIKETQYIPVIIVTAKRDVDLDFIRKLGANDFIVKPFSTNVLSDVVSRFIDQR